MGYTRAVLEAAPLTVTVVASPLSVTSPDGQQLLFTLELAPCKRYSRTFTIGQQVTTLNEEFQLYGDG